jgi:hypothetical protein
MTRALPLFLAVLACAGCQDSWDTTDYITDGPGNAIHANSAAHRVQTPSSQTNNVTIHGDGGRLEHVAESYRTPAATAAQAETSETAVTGTTSDAASQPTN